MRRQLLAAVAGAGLLLGGAGCSGDSPAPLATDDRETCREYQRIINEWGSGYGAELGAVGQAVAAGDEARRQTAVAVVQRLFTDTAAQLQQQADQVSHVELGQALTEAADGLIEIAGQIETYDDVTAAPDLMATGGFAEGGARVSSLCAES